MAEAMTELVGSHARWSLLPVVALRHAGFPLSALDPLAGSGALEATGERRKLLDEARAAGAALREHLRGTAEFSSLGPRIGMLAALADDIPGSEAYVRARAELVARWERYEAEHQERMEAGRSHVAAAFRENDALREVLLLSNDAHFEHFAAWLDRGVTVFGKRDRKMADLLVRYLQRVTSKNETTAHFGPIAAGRLVPGSTGVDWRDGGEPRRRTYFSHWAAELLAEALSGSPGLRPMVRPRRRPLVFTEDAGRVVAYAPTTTTGFLADWRFERTADEAVPPGHIWLLDRCDGERTVAELRRGWPFGGQNGGFDATLADLTERDWAVARFEIPVGVADPLEALRDALPAADASPDAARAHRVVARLVRLLADFTEAPHRARPAALAAVKQEFTALSGAEPNRGEGRHYADRAVLYEECHSRVEDLTLGSDIERLLTEELAPVYDLILAGPRLRVRRERKILADWIVRRFGAQRRVPLAEFYAGYFEDRDLLLVECDAVDRELEELDDTITDAMLADAHPGSTEVRVTAGRLRDLAAVRPDDPAVVCNPDVLLAAGSARDIEEGRVTAVLGECHAVRELLCHASYAPLLAEREPDLAELAHEAYQRMLSPDEVLCDVVRSHPNKTGAQLRFPVPDVEITGKSGKDRRHVLTPGQLYVVVRDGRAELRAEGIGQRLRPLSVPAGGRSIRQDPLAPLGFPRHYGGVSLRSRNRDRMPRISYGRTVLRRASWRVPAAGFRGSRPFPGAGDGDAADFHAVQELRERLGLPRHLFAKVPGEPKPLYVDLDAPLLVRQLCRRARGAAGKTELSEMLPGPDQLWLSLDGQGHTAELRYAVFSQPEAE
ncbi:lantibiotic dehydratase [Streptomyces sp. NBC_01408]|uniref:lantibiotic dehydratase n=1 Tax=Streptomyces sp. NBC_01408 TaxID=2903855 RepID=UPI00225254F2|nr:lantibiotic dehydratase [Streptomyces sp. NBC_01408]MCX4692887.1 lantibiotic dehydratase family protein [Streptomyces sp. NBC_01408]